MKYIMRQSRDGASGCLDIRRRELSAFEQDGDNVATEQRKQHRNGHQRHRDELDAGAKRSAESDEILACGKLRQRWKYGRGHGRYQNRHGHLHHPVCIRQR